MQKESAVNSWRWHKERVLTFEDDFWLVIRVSGVSEFQRRPRELGFHDLAS
jgi:hypothetical protein